MRRFIYLDTDTLNSYLAQIFDGLVQESETESSKGKTTEKQNRFGANLTGQIALKLFGKGVDSTAQATYEHLKTVANEDIVRDVQTKIMHDNAFVQFVSHLQEKSLIREADIQIGNFISIEDSFYIFDISFYQSLFSEKGFVGLLEEIQKQNTQKEAEQQFGELTREQRRNKDVKGKIAEIVEESNAKNHEGYDAIRKMIDMLAAIIPYPQVLCIRNFMVILDEKYMRDSLSTAAFKYGGKIKVVGYVTNKVNAQANTPVSMFAGIGNSINALMKIFFENTDEMYIVHPIAIYYDN